MKPSEKIRITVTDKGPYLVYGRPPLTQQFIQPNAKGESWSFCAGARYATDDEPTALCRCGASKNKPYCDGAHLRATWDPALTAPREPLPDEQRRYAGPRTSLNDDERYCTFARFCDAHGSAWKLVRRDDDPSAERLLVRQASLCPGGRLTAVENASGHFVEPAYDPSLGLIEDSALGVSGGLWARGGIPLQREDGTAYAVRNRAVLCRCGASKNKPYCDGAHVAVGFRDRLAEAPQACEEPAR